MSETCAREPRVLVTGGAGYVGSRLLRVLLRQGYRVTCVDNLTWGGESILDLLEEPLFTLQPVDIRDHGAMRAILSSDRFFAVIHLAAIVGDPACKLEPELAHSINWDAACALIDCAAQSGVSRFIFASTCSNYGKMADPDSYVDEDSPLAPVSLYAELKVRFEHYLLHEMAADEAFTPTALRFSTVYGPSPRMRFDLTVNEFTKDLTLGKPLQVYGGQFWRPYCHVVDFARAFCLVLEAAPPKVARQVFNVGDTAENYTKRMLVEEIAKVIPGSRIEFVHKEEDPRNFRVSFSRIQQQLGFRVSRRVPDGIREVHRIVRDRIIRNPEDPVYYNIPHSS